MSKELVEKLRKQRELTIPLDNGRAVIARRPTDVEMVAVQGRPFHELGSTHVVGWEKWIEDDIIGGGGTDEVTFSLELWREVYADRPDLWGPISTRILEEYTRHGEKLKERAKN